MLVFLGVLLLALMTDRFSKVYGSAPASESENGYQSALIQRAEELKLSQKRYWRVLLHYKPRIFGGYESEADGEAFFNALDGKTNPENELTSTLRAFFAPEKGIYPFNLHPQCRFVARFYWLDKLLDFDRRRLKVLPCDIFHDWRKEIDPKSVTMVFPSFDINHPASMFGHTLLRIDSKSEPGSKLLNHAVNFAAVIDLRSENNFSYIYSGIFGGFRGFFFVFPYYTKIKEYNDDEIRDIWEYGLNLSEDETQRLIRHLWELRFTYFDYYFFKENCSYHLLSLIEVARPELDLQSDYFLWTLPTDSLLQVYEKMGKPDGFTYRPSRYRLLRRKLDRMDESERSWFSRLKDNAGELKLLSESGLDQVQKASVLDALSAYFMINRVEDSNIIRREIHKHRAKLDIITNNEDSKLVQTPPHRSHPPGMLGFSLGQIQDQGPFLQLDLRPALHDVMNEGGAYFEHSEIQTASIQLRFLTDQTYYLERVTLFRLYSLTPRDEIVSPLSWRFKAGFYRQRVGDCHVCVNFEAEAGAGLSYHILGGLGFALSEAHYHYGRVYDLSESPFKHRLGAGFRFGYLNELGAGLKLGLEWAGVSFFSGFKEKVFEAKLMLRYALSANQEIRFNLEKSDPEFQRRLGFYAYF